MKFDQDALRKAVGAVLDRRELLGSLEEQAELAMATYLDEVGGVIVPREPTDLMIANGVAERHLSGVPEAWSKTTANIYRAMISASQE